MTPDQSLASTCRTPSFSISVALYSLAVVAFCAQLAFGRRPARDPRAGRPRAAAPGARRSPGATARRRSRAADAGWGVVAMALTALGALAHAGVLVTRGLATDRLPWGNMYEFATATVLVAVVAYLVLRAADAGPAAHRRCSCSRRSCWRWSLIGLFLYARPARWSPRCGRTGWPST